MKHLIKTLVVLACVAAWGVAAVAEDVWPPPWDASLPGQTSQIWEACGQNGTILPEGTVIPANEIAGYGNPYGYPTMTFNSAVTVQVIPGPPEPFQDIPTWHIDANGPGTMGTVTLWIPNTQIPNYHKLIFWQVTSDKSPTPSGDPPTVTTPLTGPPTTVTDLPTGLNAKKYGDSDWYTYAGLLEVRPNPTGEWITFNLAESTNISEIVIRTVCEVPEPSTLILLASGLIGLGVCAWRRR